MKPLLHKILGLLISICLSIVSYADGNFGTTQLINLNLTLNHSENGLLTGEQGFQVTFLAQKISDSSDISFNPVTGIENSHATITSQFSNGVGNIEIPVLTGGSHETLKLHTLKNLKVKIALSSSTTDFIEIPFSSTLFSIQSMTAEQLSGSTVFIDRENELLRVKKLKLENDNYEINSKSDLVSAGNGLSINATNQVSITGPDGTPGGNPFLKYNIEKNSVEWSIIEGVEEATFQASSGIILDGDTFKISTSNVSGTLTTGHLFSWDNNNNQPKWEPFSNIPIGDEIKLGENNGDEGKIRYNSTTQNFEGFTGSSWEIFNSANVTINIDTTEESEAIWSRAKGTNRVFFKTGSFKLGLGTDNPEPHRLSVSGTTLLTGNTTINGNSDITGNTNIGGNTEITGNTDIGGNTEITGNTDIGGNIDIDGNTTIGGNTSITGNLTASKIEAETAISKLHSLILNNAATDNTAVNYLIIADDGTIKKRGLSTLTDRGIELETGKLKISDTNADDHDLFRWKDNNPQWVNILGSFGVSIQENESDINFGLTTTGTASNKDVLSIKGTDPSWETVSSLLENDTITNLEITNLRSTSIRTNTTNNDAFVNIETAAGTGGQKALEVYQDGNDDPNLTITQAGQLFTGGLTAIDNLNGNTFRFANQGFGYSQHFVSATYSVGSDVFTTGSVTSPTLEARKLAQANSDPIVKVYDSGTPDTIYFSVNADKTLKLFKHTSAPTCGETEDGNIILTSQYTLCVCNGANYVKTHNPGSNCTFDTP